MSVIVPTITADNPHTFREQIERVAPFVTRLHIDIADGKLAPIRLVEPEHVWWPAGVMVDIHIMYKQPETVLEPIIRLHPNLVILHAEAEGNFLAMAKLLHDAEIKVGVALLKPTPARVLEPVLSEIDHVLIFSGDLGHFGGHVDFDLLRKAQVLHRHKPHLEIGWDGGINADNVHRLERGGIRVLNVGGFIHRANDPHAAFQTLNHLLAH